MQTKVLIVGGGEIGRAINTLLKDKRGISTRIWDKSPKLCTGSKDLAVAAEDIDFVFLCIPSHAIDDVALQIKKLCPRKALVISLTKGLERKNGKLTSEVLRKALGRNHIALLAGPMLAEEIESGLPTKAVLAGNKRVFDKVQELFARTRLSLEYSSDINGVAAAGVLKNIYSLGLGMADALELGANARGVLFTMAVREAQALVVKLGGKKETLLSLAGIGDLEATSNSPHSENRTAGQRLIHGRKQRLVSEGTMSLPILLKRIGKSKEYPLLAAIATVVAGKKNPRQTLETLLRK